MSEFDFCEDIYHRNIGIDKITREFFKLQKLEPYMPLKTEVVSNINKQDFQGIYKILNYAMPYDIESEHLKKFRDKIRKQPTGLVWNNSEKKEYENLPTDKLKRDMIIDKAGFNSIYLPILSHNDNNIYKDNKIDDKYKDSFNKGIHFYNQGKNDESMSCFIECGLGGYYKAKEFICKIALEYMETCSKKNSKLDKYNSLFLEHNKDLQDVNLSSGYYLLSKYYVTYSELYWHELSKYDKDNYKDKEIKAYAKALYYGSYDAYMEMAENHDLEWLLCAMLTNKSSINISKRITSNFRKMAASPRNFAIIKLAAMLGSYDALNNYLNPRNYCYFNMETLDSAFYYSNSRNNLLNSIYGYHPDKNKIIINSSNTNNVLLPYLDEIIEASSILYSPYNSVEYLYADYSKGIKQSYLNKIKSMYNKNIESLSDDEKLAAYKSIDIMDPRDSFSNIANQITYRTYLDECDKMQMLNKEKLDIIISNIIDKDNAEDYIFEYFGFANALKKRELDMYPLYYSMARPYIFPEEVYKSNLNWY